MMDRDICRRPVKAKLYDETNDFLSDLPDSILLHILSFLPIKDVINTVLLRRFGNLWRSVHVLDFSSCLYHNCEDSDCLPDHLNEKFVNVIRHVMDLHDHSTLDKLCLKFGFALAYSKDESLSDWVDELEWEKRTADQIEKLIRYAISRKVKVLHLDLSGCVAVDPRECYGLPDVLSSNYLTHLKLAAFDIRSCTTIDLKSLRVLLLNEVLLSDDIMQKVVLGCPSLENLSIVNCYGLRLLYCNSPNLKKVILTLSAWEGGYVIIWCPYILSLEINGWLKRAFLVDVSSVVDASIYFSYLFKCEQKSYDYVDMLLHNFRKCKTFSPCTWTILVLTIWNFTNVPCPSFEWKNLILKLYLGKWHLPGLSLLLRNSKSLETVTMHIYSRWECIFKTEEAKWIHAYDFDGENYWDSQEATFPHLDTITIYGYVNEPYAIQIVEFLLKTATRLQKLVIKPIIEKLQLTPEQLQALSQRFKSLPRASLEATVHFS